MADEVVGDTLVRDSGAVAPAASTGAARTTVLPRVEWAGPEPTVQPTLRHRFEELGLLGEGGMGEVVLAQDHDIDRTVALKRLPRSGDLGQVLRFAEEIRTVGRLEHPNIVPVHDVGVDAAGRYFFVMKHLQGETLEAIIDRLRTGDEATHARFPIPVRLQLFLGVLHALAYAHRQGFVHRDLKPANIMVGPFGEVTVMDWGLAKRVRAATPELPAEVSTRAGTALETQLGVIIGTPLYMSPEQARGDHDAVDERSDLYSLTVLLHELLHLEHYLAGRTGVPEVLEGVKSTVPRLPHASPRGPRYQVPTELDWYLARGFRKAPGERYQSAEEMIDQLQAILRGECRVSCPVTFLKRSLNEGAKLVDRRPVLVLTTALALGALALAGVVRTVLALVS